MKKIVTKILIVSTIILTNSAFATVWTVSSGESIQQAIDNAGSGDTVQVDAGTYYENLTISKSLTLQGQDKATTVVNGSGAGNVIAVTAPNVTITNLTITDGNNGVYYDNAPSTTIEDCDIHHNYENGISLWYSNNATIKNCDIYDSYADDHAYKGFAITMFVASNSLLENVRAFDNKSIGRTVNIYHASGTIIRNIQVFDNPSAIGLGLGFGSYYVTDAYCHNNMVGIWFNAGSNCTVRRSLLSNNTNAFSIAWHSSNNIIEENIVIANGAGVSISSYSYSGTRFYHNDFIDNINHVSGPANLQIWDNGYPSGGNYWSDYSGIDNFSGPAQNIPGSDNIGDTPYDILAIDQDNYPLMKPFNPFEVQIDILPDDFPNFINPNSKGTLPVAIFSTEIFDATTIDPATIQCCKAYVETKGKHDKLKAHPEDVDGDGIIDLVVQFSRTQLDPSELATGYAMLTGETYQGQVVVGKDSVTTSEP